METNGDGMETNEDGLESNGDGAETNGGWVKTDEADDQVRIFMGFTFHVITSCYESMRYLGLTRVDVRREV